LARGLHGFYRAFSIFGPACGGIADAHRLGFKGSDVGGVISAGGRSEEKS
jgi:hypothetical protein